MASRKLVRDLLLSHNSNRKSLLLPFTSHQTSRLRLNSAEYCYYLRGFRQYNVLNEFSKKIKGEAERTRQKAEDLLSKQADEAEAAAKKVSYTVKEKISSATEEVKETFGIGKEDSSGSTGSSTKQGNGAKQGSHTSPNEEQNQQFGSSTSSKQEENQQFGSSNASDSLFGKFKSTISSPHVSAAFQKLKDAKLVNVVKRGYDIVKEELSTREEVVVVPSKQSWWSKTLDEIKDKVRAKFVKSFPRARKAWKSFTSSLGKLHKIHRSKAMKKTKKNLNTTPTKTTTSRCRRAPKFLVTKRSNHKKRLANIKGVIYGFKNKKPAPVYVDKLFKESSCELVDHLKPQIAHDPCNSDDDLWESLALASPLMHGIDERAEEFIARFRGELARNL
ncbi:hypothetical protein RIF29_28591 [Crotalaria pallida]|uniref:Uncharacterized protein n=1 Tax=Crotalaria pallida TaxID=3830 RepID=A0AAN9HV61_CROPI